MDTEPPDYENSKEWADIVPIPQNEGGPNPLAAIAYSEEYSTAMSYLRAMMAADEHSPRVFKVTEHVIRMNPAHYTVWLYRAATLRSLRVPPETELEWLNKVSMTNLKNYQIWHHREVVMSDLRDLPKDEMPFLARTLAKDAKNYHVWSYRQWLVRHFGLWPDTSETVLERNVTGTAREEDEVAPSTAVDVFRHKAGEAELRFTEVLIEDDVRNNSAWNHRFFVLFGRENAPQPAVWVLDREVGFSKDKIAQAPQNVAAWNYLRGVSRLRKRRPLQEERLSSEKGTDALKSPDESSDLSDLEGFAGQFAQVDGPLEEIQSSHALELLSEIWMKKNEISRAKKALQILADELEPIRKGYWEFLMKQIPRQEVAAA